MENPGADSLQLPGMEICHTDLSVGRSCATHIMSSAMESPNCSSLVFTSNTLTFKKTGGNSNFYQQ
jgi:hypothetical protein